MTKNRTALISVTNKDGVVPFAKALKELNWEIISTGGTAKILEEAGISIIPVEKVTGNPEAFDGRMKTISFQIESGILFNRNNPAHQKEVSLLGIRPIDMVVCNFYQFPQKKELTLGSNDFDLHIDKVPIDMIELIDIGGPTMVRAAAKNFQHVIVIVDPKDYLVVEKGLEEKGDLSEDKRLLLAAKAFQYIADYDCAIEAVFNKLAAKTAFKDSVTANDAVTTNGGITTNVARLKFFNGRPLRYGENPHQKGFFYSSCSDSPSADASLAEDLLAIDKCKQLHGKELSFNNILDLDAVISFLSLQGGEKPTAVVVKHTNPCGAATGAAIEEAFQLAWEGDPLAAYGGIVGLNRPVTVNLAQDMIKEKRFVEALLAPRVEPEALELFKSNRKNMIVLVNPALNNPFPSQEMDIKKVRGGILVQDPDTSILKAQDLKLISGELNDALAASVKSDALAASVKNYDIVQDLLFAWNICKISKSNSIILVRKGQLVGSGVGSQDRKRACELAVKKAGERAKDSVCASDAFFPFSDGPEILVKAGVKAILHPGGSIRDQETIDLCRKTDVILVTTGGIRAFKH